MFTSCKADEFKPLPFISLISGMLLSVVSLSTNATTLIHDTEYLEYQLPKSIQDQCFEQRKCPDITIKYLNTNHSWINDIANKRIDNLIVNILLTESAPIAINSKSEVKAALDKFAQSQFTDLPEDRPWTEELLIQPDYKGHIDDFEIFEINTYTFMGGAHGSSYSEYLMFDPSIKTQVKLADMIQVGKKPYFEALAYDAYKTWVKTMDEDIVSYEKNWPFEMSDNIILTDKGIDIRYQQYAIGPYAYGMPVLSIPNNKLRGIIKTKYIAR